MKQQKIRGHKRRHKNIQKWILENSELRFDLLKKYDYNNIDIVVHPWCDISIINSQIPEPRGKTKQLILDGLIEIYSSWKDQLNNINRPYYLKIWLYEPRFSKSQVVCAVGDRIDHYENLFFLPSQSKKLNTSNFGYLRDKLENISWTYCLDEDSFDNDDIEEAEETKNWFIKTLKKAHRTTKINDTTEYYSFKKGNIWVGG